MILLRCDQCDTESEIELMGSFGANLPGTWEVDHTAHWCSTKCRLAWIKARDIKRKPGDARDPDELCRCGHLYGEHSARGTHACRELRRRQKPCDCTEYQPRPTKDDVVTEPS